MLDSASNQIFKFRTKNWVEINDKSRGTHSFNRQINFKTSMLRSNTNQKVIFKNFAWFTGSISKISNNQINNAKGIDIVIPMYNLR